MERKLREESHLPTEGWSDWVRAIVPESQVNNEESYIMRNEGNLGYYCKRIEDAFQDYKCGIYELQLRHPNMVVYIGSTCRDKECSQLLARILEYCKDGSHKNDLINEALENGYEIFIRVKETGRSKVKAEEEENELLKCYDYAWNKRQNGRIRDL